jgi:hypothetical protein
MELWHILLLLLGHTVADFVFQNDNTAKRKGKSNTVLTTHVCIYTGVLALFTLPIIFTVPAASLLPQLWVLFMVINFVAHFATDFVTSRLTAHFWLQEKRHEFFVTIGFDQFAHMAVLLLTYSALLV